MRSLLCVPMIVFPLLAGCSYSYPVEAIFIRDKLHFVAKDKLNGCLNDFRIVSEAGEIMWAIESDFRSSPCPDNFPLAYGVAPIPLKTKVAAKPLKVGVRYRIEGSDGDRYYGAFFYRGVTVVTNTPESARARQ